MFHDNCSCCKRPLFERERDYGICTRCEDRQIDRHSEVAEWDEYHPPARKEGSK